ncbi:hypothetical protein PDJAM_G00078220, partial [Pangasius djambal]|nr:hypothetical protein [Pangasius djambal]
MESHTSVHRTRSSRHTHTHTHTLCGLGCKSVSVCVSPPSRLCADSLLQLPLCSYTSAVDHKPPGHQHHQPHNLTHTHT